MKVIINCAATEKNTSCILGLQILWNVSIVRTPNTLAVVDEDFVVTVTDLALFLAMLLYTM